MLRIRVVSVVLFLLVFSACSFSASERSTTQESPIDGLYELPEGISPTEPFGKYLLSLGTKVHHGRVAIFPSGELQTFRVAAEEFSLVQNYVMLFESSDDLVRFYEADPAEAKELVDSQLLYGWVAQSQVQPFKVVLNQSETLQEELLGGPFSSYEQVSEDIFQKSSTYENETHLLLFDGRYFLGVTVPSEETELFIDVLSEIKRS